MKISEAEKLIDYISKAGERIAKKAGSIEDIGIKKRYLTEEDIAIERDIKNIVLQISDKSVFYAEEEHDNFVDNESVWICDPISGTKLFIQGLPHYAIVVCHLNRGIVDLAIVHDPSTGDLFMADRGSGAFLNNKPLKISGKSGRRIIFAPTSYGSVSQEMIDAIRQALRVSYEVFPSQGSFALNYCLVALGEFDGVASITKDSYPEFAGLFIANMAGYTATNILGNKDIIPTDRHFVCGGSNHQDLLRILRSIVNK